MHLPGIKAGRVESVGRLLVAVRIHPHDLHAAKTTTMTITTMATISCSNAAVLRRVNAVSVVAVSGGTVAIATAAAAAAATKDQSCNGRKVGWSVSRCWRARDDAPRGGVIFERVRPPPHARLTEPALSLLRIVMK